MLIDFSKSITDFNGNPVKDGEGEGAKILTLSTVAINALLGTLPDQNGRPEQLSGEGKVRHAALAQSIYNSAGDMDVKLEDLALLKERIGRSYGPLTVLRAWSILEGDHGK